MLSSKRPYSHISLCEFVAYTFPHCQRIGRSVHKINNNSSGTMHNIFLEIFGFGVWWFGRTCNLLFLRRIRTIPYFLYLYFAHLRTSPPNLMATYSLVTVLYNHTIQCMDAKALVCSLVRRCPSQTILKLKLSWRSQWKFRILFLQSN